MTRIIIRRVLEEIKMRIAIDQHKNIYEVEPRTYTDIRDTRCPVTGVDLSVSDDGDMVVEHVYNPLVMRTKEGNELGLCMRDDTIEMTVPGTNRHYRVDMKTGEIHEM